MELRHLRYFIAVAEELSFTRAAKRLGINQPPLSLQIQQLEKELGAKLFRRETRGVTLTDAGKLMLEEAHIILTQVEATTTGVRRRARGETGQLIIGSVGGSYVHPVIPTIIREYGLKYPHVVLAPQASNHALLVARLCAGQVDIAFIWRAKSERDNDDLMIEPLAGEDTVMVLPAGHPLGNCVSAPLAALAKETFALWTRAIHPWAYDAVIEACQQEGFTPKLGQEAPDILSIMPLVAAGFGVSIVPRSASRFLLDGVTYLSIEGNAPRAQICLAHRRHDRSPAVQNFVSLARRVMRTIELA